MTDTGSQARTEAGTLQHSLTLPPLKLYRSVNFISGHLAALVDDSDPSQAIEA